MKLNIFKRKKRVHLDYASTTPVSPRVYEAMRPYWSEKWANPSAIYQEGVRAREAIEKARLELARTLHVRPAGLTFTSGGTESNNLALIGTVEAEHERGERYEEMEIISTRVEHPSILETLSYLTRRGVQVKYASVGESGLLMAQSVEALLSDRTIMVTCAYVNSEVGVINDVKAITRAVRKWNEMHSASVRVHLDASQAPLWLSCELDMLGIDLMTLDAGKCFGPKGAGVLARRHGVDLSPILYGGGQEHGLRSGTENTALIIGCVRAIVDAQHAYEERSEKVRVLRDYFFDLLKREIPHVIENGNRDERVANNVNISLPGMDTEYAVIWLDTKGIACSTKSACGMKGKDGSSVIREMTHDEERARSTIRFTLGEETTREDIRRAVDALKEHLTLTAMAKRN